MSIFNEREIEAGHYKLASLILNSIGVLGVCTDITRRAVLSVDFSPFDEDRRRDAQAIKLLANRYVNATGAATKLLDAGYFIQALSLFRDIAETGMLFLTFDEQNAMVRKWHEIDSAKRHGTFGRSKLKELISDKEKFEYFNEFFDLHSGLGTHPSSQSIVAQYDGETLHDGPYINKRLYIEAHKDLARLVWHVTLAAGEFWESFAKVNLEQKFPQELTTFHQIFGTWEQDPTQVG